MAERQHARNKLLRTSLTRNETVAGQVWINGWKIKEGRAFVASERVARLYRPWGRSVVCASGSRGPTAGPISVTRCIVCVNRRRGGRWHRCHRLPLCGQSMHTIAGRTRTPVMSLYRHQASGAPSFARAPFVRPSMPFLTSRVGVELSSADYPSRRISNSVAKRTLARVFVRASSPRDRCSPRDSNHSEYNAVSSIASFDLPNGRSVRSFNPSNDRFNLLMWVIEQEVIEEVD